MSRERFDEALVEELERDLREALRIEPSPDFAHKVRARIAERRSPGMWRRFVLPVAAMCVLAVGLAVWSHWRANAARECQAARVPECQSAVRGRDVRLRPSEERVKPDAAVAASRAPSRPVITARPATSRPAENPTPEAEVIVPPDRALALARFLELARAGEVNEETLRPLTAAAAPAVLEIAPLVVPPLSVPELEPQSGAAESGADRE